MLDKSVPYKKLYAQAVRLFRTRKPVIAVVQGAAIGGGLGLALSADFRVACHESRFAANFAKLGFHPDLVHLLLFLELLACKRPRICFLQQEELQERRHFKIGLVDKFCSKEKITEEAEQLAMEIASSAPMAVESIRSTLRGNLADQIEQIVDWELSEQVRLQKTEDFKTGIAASLSRETPQFKESNQRLIFLDLE